MVKVYSVLGAVMVVVVIEGKVMGTLWVNASM
jgi:hypothetical protein